MALLLFAPACQTASSHPDTDAGAGQGGSPGQGGATAGTGGHASGGSSGTGGKTGGATGGTTGGALGGMTGAGGSGGGTPDAGSGAGGGGAVSCASLPLCDDFESSTPGGPPKASLWTLIPTANVAGATIDTIGAHGSSRSVKLTNVNRLYLRNSAVIGTLGPVVHVRFNVRFSTPLPAGHGAMVVSHPVVVNEFDSHPEFRFGNQDSVFRWNTDTDEANIPDVSPMGTPTSVTAAANTWYCVELTINRGNGHLNVSVDGHDVAGLTEDGVPTPNIDQAWINSADSVARYAMMTDINFGWESFGAGSMTLWFDDLALSAAPIGCQN